MMAVDKDPSIYHDRGSIGSDDDLDEYGVWVKSEPQVVSDTTLTGTGLNDDDLLEPGLPDIEDLPDLALDSNDMVSDALAEDDGFADSQLADSDTESFSNESPLAEIPDLEDFGSFDLPEEETLMEASAGDETAADFDLSDNSFDLPDMEPLDDEEQSMTEHQDGSEEFSAVGESADFEDGEISLDEFGVDFDVDPSGAETPSATSPSSGSADEEISMDEFIDPSDFGFDSEPLPAAADSEEPAMDIDLEFAEEESASADEFDSSDIFDNIVDETPTESGDTMSLSGMDDLNIEEVGDFDSFLNGTDSASTSSSVGDLGAAAGVAAGAALGAALSQPSGTDDAGDSEFADIDIGIELDDEDGASPFMSANSQDDNNFDDLNVRLDEADASMDAELDATLPDTDEHFDDLAALGRELEESDSVEEEETSADEDIAAAFMAGENEDEGTVAPEPAFEEPEMPRAPAQSGEAAAASLSTQLLMRIADELSSIKNEITALKTELSVLKEGASLPVEASESASEGNVGFFADEEDEKIALTGDELDNILNTANFTEEDGADAGVIDDYSDSNELAGEELEEPLEQADSFEPDATEEDIELDIDTMIPGQEEIAEECDESGEFLSDLPDILADEESGEEEKGRGLDSEVDVVEHIEEDIEETVEDDSFAFDADSLSDISDGNNDFEELDLSEAFSLDGESHEADEKLSKLAEEGVQPLTPAPEDSSYLEEDVDLSQAVIEEPDLGDITLEEPAIEEPALDEIILDEDLAVAEENFTMGPLEDMSAVEEEEIISIPAASESFEDIVPEDFSMDDEEDIAEAQTQEDVPLMEEAESDGAPELAETVAEDLPPNLKNEVKAVLAYMDQLLESLPEDKIEEFAKSEYFDTYKKLFEELGLS